MAMFLGLPSQPIINLDHVIRFYLQPMAENQRPVLVFEFINGTPLRISVDEKVGNETINSILSHKSSLVLNGDGTIYHR